jgi:hypothetical protein
VGIRFLFSRLIRLRNQEYDIVGFDWLSEFVRAEGWSWHAAEKRLGLDGSEVGSLMTCPSFMLIRIEYEQWPVITHMHIKRRSLYLLDISGVRQHAKDMVYMP